MIRNPFGRRSAGSLIVSIAIHVAIVFALINIVWRYPLGQIMGIRQPEDTRPERLQYIVLPAAPGQPGSGSDTASAPTAEPAPLRAPATVPASGIPSPTDTVPSQSAGGTGTGLDAGGGGPATGVIPRLPDPRIALSTGGIARVPRTMAEDVDSIVDVAIGIYNDSMAMMARQRKPGDWTKKGKDGELWGWDQQGIRLGKWTIPNALLAHFDQITWPLAEAHAPANSESTRRAVDLAAQMRAMWT